MIVCTKCSRTLPSSSFTVKNRDTGKRSTICKECFNIYQRAHYKLNKSKYIAKNKRHEQRNRKQLQDLKNVPCLDCGKSFPPYVMDFDHVRGEKRFNIGSTIIRRATSWSKIMEEVEKCDIVCANCHRERTHAGGPRVDGDLTCNEEVAGSTPVTGSKLTEYQTGDTVWVHKGKDRSGKIWDCCIIGHNIKLEKLPILQKATIEGYELPKFYGYGAGVLRIRFANGALSRIDPRLAYYCLEKGHANV